VNRNEPQRSTVAYCRVSTIEQTRGYGIEIQERDIEAFAERQRILIARWYKDEGESGVRENRTELRRLLRDCTDGRVGTIVIPALDRLSRDVRLAENLFHKFERLGITVLIADMPTYNAKNCKDSSSARFARRLRRKTERTSSSGFGRVGRSGCERDSWPAATSPTATGARENSSSRTPLKSRSSE
jgi:DNA invertase Pin-like site-specific DNA recombinase